MSLSSAWQRLTKRFRNPTLAEAQLDDRKIAEAEIALCKQMIRHNEYIMMLAQSKLDAINNFEKVQKNEHAVRVS